MTAGCTRGPWVTEDAPDTRRASVFSGIGLASTNSSIPVDALDMRRTWGGEGIASSLTREDWLPTDGGETERRPGRGCRDSLGGCNGAVVKLGAAGADLRYECPPDREASECTLRTRDGNCRDGESCAGFRGVCSGGWARLLTSPEDWLCTTNCRCASGSLHHKCIKSRTDMLCGGSSCGPESLSCSM